MDDSVKGGNKIMKLDLRLRITVDGISDVNVGVTATTSALLVREYM